MAPTQLLWCTLPKNYGPVVCNDAETQVTQEGSDENTAN